MSRVTIAAALLISAFMVPVYAADTMMKCDDASMMKAQSDLDTMKDPMMKDKKEMASKEVMMAKKMDDCKMHMDKAMKSMGKM